MGNIFEVARLLVRSGVSVRTAKKAVETLLAGQQAFVSAPSVVDFVALKKAMAAENLAVQRIQRQEVNIKALRRRLGITQEAFAGRYGLDVKTFVNWEQGRTKPNRAACVLLQLIDRDPDKVVELLAS